MVMRSTKTWSPISSVFSIELEGISNAWMLKVIMKSPVTSTTAMEERNSMGVSFFFRYKYVSFHGWIIQTRQKSADQVKCPVPTSVLWQVDERIQQTFQFTIGGGGLFPLHRPVDQERPA